jgi:hypothetical protein
MSRRATISEPTPFPVHGCPYPRGAPQLNQAHPSASRRRDQGRCGERLRVSCIHPFASAGSHQKMALAPVASTQLAGVCGAGYQIVGIRRGRAAREMHSRHRIRSRRPLGRRQSWRLDAPYQSGMATPPGDGEVLTNGITHHARICRGTAGPNSRAVIPPFLAAPVAGREVPGAATALGPGLSPADQEDHHPLRTCAA